MSSPAISINNLTKDFSLGIRGLRLRAVENLSLEIGDNMIFGLLGPNGSGKSTTIKIILGLLQPTHGSCRIFGTASNNVETRSNVGFLPEAPYFYKYLTGRELVKFYAKICNLRGKKLKERVESSIELVRMTDAADRRVGTYSKGMLQRIGLAQTLVHDPRLVILDEPTAGVDPIGAADIGDIIRELKTRGKTVLLCSHLLSHVENICDNIAIINKGKLILKGQVDDLLKHKNERAIVVDDYNESIMEPLKELLAKHGSKLTRVENPRRRLEELFLSKIMDNKNKPEASED